MTFLGGLHLPHRFFVYLQAELPEVSYTRDDLNA